jgi:hypothetical protein
METLILGVGLVAFPVFQLHTQRVGRPAGQLVHHLIAQPVLSSRVTEALQGGRQCGWLHAQEEG